MMLLPYVTDAISFWIESKYDRPSVVGWAHLDTGVVNIKTFDEEVEITMDYSLLTSEGTALRTILTNIDAFLEDWANEAET
jgi:hypothetical protein